MATKCVLHTAAPATADAASSQRQSIAPFFSSRARASRLSEVNEPNAQTAAASTTSGMLCCPVMQLNTFIMKRFSRNRMKEA
jgi:hypothetical protein